MYIKDFVLKLIIITGLVIVLMLVSGANVHVSDPYSRAVDFDYSVKRLQSVNTQPDLLGGDIDTVVTKQNTENAEMFNECLFALLIGESDNQVYVAKNAHRRMYPASLTKLMTGIIVCDRIEAGVITLDDEVTVTDYYDLTDEGVGPSPLTYGDTISVKDLLYALMIESNNYYALILADYVAGDEASFCKLMNEKAHAIGATNTHFANPHGLDDPDHYSTAYDMYLIIKEAHSHELMRKIDEFDNYAYTYTDAAGNVIDMEAEATNYFVNGNAQLPAGVKLSTWKTGTTDGAGYCLALYFEKNGKKYVSVASVLEDKIGLYDATARLLSMVN